MEAIDEMYRVSRSIRERLKNDRQAKSIRNELGRAVNLGSINVSYKKCTIQEEWILEIEEKLTYVERAIDEGRHALKKEGDVVRIDQVKKVSSDSIRHLAQHSNYITDAVEDMENIVPSKLYVTENSDNYQLYENRFLYTLLLYLHDFVEVRFSAITDITREEKTNMELACDINAEKKRIKLNLNFFEENLSKEADSADENSRALLGRIRAISDEICVLQNKPLMKMMADLDPLKLPIVATNIIKSNPNFNESYKLLDYIISYEKQGYDIEEVSRNLKGLSAEASEDIATVIALLDLTADIEISGKRIQMEREYLESREDELTAENRSLLEDMRKLHKAEILKARQEEELRYRELLLLKDAEIDLLKIRLNDFSEDDHLDEDSFKRLTEEKRIFDKYYEERWSKVKKRARKKYIWDRFRNK